MEILSANIKLPSDYTAGVCVAFYTSNGDVFEKTHDELDFEFLGNIGGKPWRFQTNLYGNGSTHRGREERYRLWFDPSYQAVSPIQNPLVSHQHYEGNPGPSILILTVLDHAFMYSIKFSSYTTAFQGDFIQINWTNRLLYCVNGRGKRYSLLKESRLALDAPPILPVNFESV
ncbi:hypothetical protein K1719_039934 [Acacia pycnantha]|nr:hypothetical protein K1719_039934 [Acacia pycnantha]